MKIADIAFDESGGDGENLAGATHEVFSHGSVNLDQAEATAFMHELREASGQRSGELKARTALKMVDRANLLQLIQDFRLADDRANIYIVEKSFFLAGKIVSLLIENEAYEQGHFISAIEQQRMADVLAARGASALGDREWDRLLSTFNRLIKRPPARGGLSKQGAAEAFYAALNDSRAVAKDEDVRQLLQLAWDARLQVSGYENASESFLRELDPTVPALATETATWGLRLDGAPFTFTHDEHWSLSEEAIDVVVSAAAVRYLVPPGDLRGIRTVNSASDSRIQVADIVAGIGRYAAEMALRGTYDDPLQQAIQPLLDFNSMHSSSSGLNELIDATKLGYLERYVAAVREARG